MTEQTSGTSRREVLRGSAIGMGALAAAVALTNAVEESADAQTTGGGLLFMVGFSVTGLNNKVQARSISFGGTNPAGTP